jgi:hypothetical protein
MQPFLHTRYSFASLDRPVSPQLACLYCVLYFFRQEVKGGPKAKTPQLETGRTFLRGKLYQILKFSQGKSSPINVSCKCR